MKCLYHVSDETVVTRVDGHMFIIPPNEVFEVEEVRGNDRNNNGSYEYVITDAQIAKLIISRKPFIVEVPMHRTKGGVSGDVDTAKKDAKAALELHEDSMLNKYINDQQERTMRENKPPLAPSAPIVKILEKRGLDLDKDFNLKVPGLAVGRFRDRDAEIDALNQKIDNLMAALGEKKGK